MRKGDVRPRDVDEAKPSSLVLIGLFLIVHGLVHALCSPRTGFPDDGREIVAGDTGGPEPISSEASSCRNDRVRSSCSKPLGAICSCRLVQDFGAHLGCSLPNLDKPEPKRNTETTEASQTQRFTEFFSAPPCVFSVKLCVYKFLLNVQEFHR